MSTPAITIGPARPVVEAAAKMIDRMVNRLPVVDDDGALVGIVTRADLVRAFLRTDGEISREIREDVILHTLWIPPEYVTVQVRDGEVELTGHLDSEADADMIARLCRRVPGVMSVNSKLTSEPEEKRSRRNRMPIGAR